LSVRPRSGKKFPSLTAQVERASNPGGTTAMWVRGRLNGLWRDEDFADWYPRDRCPGLSPARLATGLVQDGRADRLLDLSPARLKEAGLVRERTGSDRAILAGPRLVYGSVSHVGEHAGLVGAARVAHDHVEPVVALIRAIRETSAAIWSSS
jgi:hypothetical protein